MIFYNLNLQAEPVKYVMCGTGLPKLYDSP
jgi:hypothetical protein